MNELIISPYFNYEHKDDWKSLIINSIYNSYYVMYMGIIDMNHDVFK